MAPSEKKRQASKNSGGSGAGAGGETTAEAKQEDELKASLERLQNAFKQLNEIRLSVQKMLQPLHSTAAEPEMVYASFADTAQKTVREVKEFEAAMKEEKMQQLLKRSKEWSLMQENANGWLGALNPTLDKWHMEEETGAAANKLDALKIERQATPKKS